MQFGLGLKKKHFGKLEVVKEERPRPVHKTSKKSLLRKPIDAVRAWLEKTRALRYTARQLVKVGAFRVCSQKPLDYHKGLFRDVRHRHADCPSHPQGCLSWRAACGPRCVRNGALEDCL